MEQSDVLRPSPGVQPVQVRLLPRKRLELLARLRGELRNARRIFMRGVECPCKREAQLRLLTRICAVLSKNFERTLDQRNRSRRLPQAHPSLACAAERSGERNRVWAVRALNQRRRVFEPLESLLVPAKVLQCL